MEKPLQRKRKRALLETVQEDDGNSKFARALGSVDNQTREKGLQALSIWLSKKEDLTEQDLTRLWKGIFYCFWHADKAPFQEDLALRLADILPSLTPKVAFLYFTVFLRTMRREWFGIDRLRLDKFMMLVRKFTRALFQYLQAQQWDMSLVQQFMSYVETRVLLCTDSHPAAGLTYHLADVYVVELTEVCRTEPPSTVVLTALLAPFCQVMAKSSRAAFLPRLREAIFDTLIKEVLHPSEKLPLRHLAVQELADHLFHLGASPETHARNRQELYEVSKALEQAAKKQLSTTAGKQGKKVALINQKPNLRVDKPIGMDASQRNIRQSESGAGKKKRQRDAEFANGQAPGCVESPDAFAKEATAALNKAAELPLGALAQVNGKQLKKLKKKQRTAAGMTAADSAPASMSQQKHAAQLAGAAEAVPLKLKDAKVAQQLPADLQDMDAALQPLSGDKSAKKQKSKGTLTTAVSKTQNAKVAEGLPMANGHSASASDGTASQRKKRVRFAMKRNLLMQIGGAVPPEEIRTPPDSRPKGSALKLNSLMAHKEMANGSGKRHDQGARANAKAGSGHSNAQAKLFF